MINKEAVFFNKIQLLYAIKWYNLYYFTIKTQFDLCCFLLKINIIYSL